MILEMTSLCCGFIDVEIAEYEIPQTTELKINICVREKLKLKKKKKKKKLMLELSPKQLHKRQKKCDVHSQS